jgi:hypothetical protein
LDIKTYQNRIYLEDIGETVMSLRDEDIRPVKGITQHEDFKDRCRPQRIYGVDFPAGVPVKNIYSVVRIVEPKNF